MAEMQVASLLAAQIDELLPYPDGHCSRLATLAGRMGEELGTKGKELAALKLAALLHDVGRAMEPAEGEDPDEALQDAAERAGRYALTSGGEDVAQAVQNQRKRWDGEGPKGIAADEIPLFTRIIAVADAIDIWMRPGPDEAPLGSAAVVEKPEEEAGTRFDPSVAGPAAGLL